MTTLIGAILGLLLLHSAFGLVIGGAAGWMLSSFLRRRAASAVDYVAPLFAVLGAVAKADGRVSDGEIAVAERLMQRLELSPAQRKVAIENFNRGKQPDFDAHAAMARLREWTAGRHDLARIAMDVVLDMVLIEGASQAKLDFVTQLARILRINPLELVAMMAMKGYAFSAHGAAGFGRGGFGQGGFGYGTAGAGAGAGAGQGGQAFRTPGRPDPYVILGVERDADERSIKRAYRKLISEHHPDRLGDLPEDLRRRAEQRAAEINAAYEQIRSERGFR